MIENHTITPNELKDVLKVSVQERFPLMIWGPPGVGKSQVTREVAEEIGYDFYDIRASLIDPVDLRGLPHIENGITKWAPPAFLPPSNGDGKYLVMLDEITVAAPAIQASLYQLVQDRRIGEYTLPVGAAVVAAGNRPEDLGVSNRMPAPLASRMLHETVMPQPRQFQEYILLRDLDHRVALFVQFKPDLLHNFNAEAYRKGQIAFGCPRMWEWVARIMQSEVNGQKVWKDKELLSKLVIGAVGEAAGTEFLAFMEIWKELPRIPTILAAPSVVDIPTNISAQIALCGAIVNAADKSNIDNLLIYGKRLKPELHQFLMTLIHIKKPRLQNSAAYTAFISNLH